MPRTMVASPVQMQVQEQFQQFDDPHRPLLLWHKLALGVVLVVSTFFNFFALNNQDYFEYYYAAAIKSMLLSWHNLFFLSFDPGGFLAIDKPPLGFWMQVLSVKLFGYSVFSILFPEALAGVLAVAVLFHLVRRIFGPLAGLIAALALAISPISIATNRNNVVDSLLVLTVLLATWMVSKAAETGRLRWLCLCAVLIGLGFNIKYLQAYMVIPAFSLAYWLGAPVRWQTKFCHLAVALGILLLVSLCWVTTVDLIPASQRPVIDSTTTNTELDLAFGYNGTFRLTAGSFVVNRWAWEIGRPGVIRFFEQPVAGQCGWLLPLALLSLLTLMSHKKWHLPFNRQQQALVLWGTWLFTMLVFFSNAHFFHLYYLSLMAPAIAALTGAGVVMLWQDYLRYGWRGWLLPCALLLTGVAQAYYLAAYPLWGRLLAIGMVSCSVIVALVRWHHFPQPEAECQSGKRRNASSIKRHKKILVPSHSHTFNGNGIIVFEQRLQRVAMIMTALSLFCLLLAPTIWSAIPLSQKGRAFPMAGPPVPQTFIPRLLADPMSEKYLLAHRDKTQFLLATLNTEVASPFIIDTGLPVMSLGGYNGDRSFLTREQLIQRIDHGLVRFFLLPWSNYPAESWVISHCWVVPTTQWQSRSTTHFPLDVLPLYDCAHHK